MDADRTLVEFRAAKPLELSRIAQIRAQDLVVLGPETNQSVVRLRFLAMQAQQSQASSRWSCLEAQSRPPRTIGMIKRDTVGFVSMASSSNTDQGR
ncbi:hypothetical protein D6B98_37635 [Bradyrhizobium sp. LVM 105]|nr:hypothetical protein D6B98_37635 [Bradyrhizobium sp. LVM 105]